MKHTRKNRPLAWMLALLFVFLCALPPMAAGDAASTEASSQPAAALSAKTATTYALTVTNGTDTTSGGPYVAGTVVNITANAAPAGQVFDIWTSDNGGTFNDATAANTTFTMPTNASSPTFGRTAAAGQCGIPL